MDERKSSGSNRIALIALLVSLLSMVGTVGNFLYGIYSRQKAEQLGLALRCEVDPVAKVRLIEAETEIAVDSVGGMMAVGPGALKHKPPFTTYPSFLLFDANCRITNVSSRKIAIESITASAVFEHESGIQDRAISRGVVDLTDNAPRFPRLLEQGEQVIYKVHVGRPLPTQLQYTFEAIFDGKVEIYAIDARIPEAATGADDKLVPALRIEVASSEHKSYVEQLRGPPFPF